ncbi:MAG TPA: CoA transferase [Candidatus Dormibacteraeota bacterium]|nr:CoA transferase [Candidatus Dormibacteraeota bacterium]
MGAGILSGLRIVEISAFVAAPIGGATLAAMGADVIRVDPPGGGVDIGRWPLHRGRSLYWAGLNQGKRSVTIDTRLEPGQEKVAKLITAPGEGGGILLTNLPVSGWKSYEELKKRRVDLIMVTITGNRDGTAAVDYTVNAALGFPAITGPEESEGPVNHVLPAWDAMTGFLAATAILAAERHRRLTGKGQLVELSLADVGLAVAGHLGLIGEAVLEDEPRGRFGNEVYGTFGRDFTTRDGRRVMVLALTPRQWRSLVEATGLSGEFRNLEARLSLYFNNEGDRWRGRQEISTLLQDWIAVRNLTSVAAAFDAHNVMWGPYQTFKQLVTEDPRVSASNSILEQVDHPGLGTFPTAGSPFRFGAADPVAPRPAPRLGEHTEEVLREFGLS